MPYRPYSDPVPTRINQYHLKLIKYHQVPTIVLLYTTQYTASSPRNAQLTQLDWIQLSQYSYSRGEFLISLPKSKFCQLSDTTTAVRDRSKIKAICGDLGHCSLLFNSDPNAVYLPPNAVYWFQGSFLRSSLLPLLSFVASPPFQPEKNNTSFVF